MAAPRRPKLTGCVGFKKLTFAEPRMLKLGWWGGQIKKRILSLFKKNPIKAIALVLCYLPLEVCHDLRDTST